MDRQTDNSGEEENPVYQSAPACNTHTHKTTKKLQAILTYNLL